MSAVDEIRAMFPHAVWAPPAQSADIVQTARRLGIAFPAELLELYSAFDGFCALGTDLLWKVSGMSGPNPSIEYANALYRKNPLLSKELAGILFYGSSIGEFSLGYRIADGIIVEYSPFFADTLAEYASGVIEAYRRVLADRTAGSPQSI